MTRYVPIKSIKPIIAGRPNALSKMSLLEFIFFRFEYVKKYNLNINICKAITVNYAYINIFKTFCSDYVSVTCIFCVVILNLVVNLYRLTTRISRKILFVMIFVQLQMIIICVSKSLLIFV